MSSIIFTVFKKIFPGIFPGSEKAPDGVNLRIRTPSNRNTPGNIDGSGAGYIQLIQEKKNPGIGLGVKSLAGNSNSGKRPVFDVPEVSKIMEVYNDYVRDTEAGVIALPAWQDYIFRLGTTTAEVKKMLLTVSQGDTYYPRAEALRKNFAWFESQWASNPAWATTATGKKALEFLQADFTGSGIYRKQEKQTDTRTDIQVNFGSGDSRSNKAVK